MPQKLTPHIAFPPGIPVPENLQVLVDAVNDGALDPYALGGDFGLEFDPVTNKAFWFARPPTPSALYAAEQLAAFGYAGDGSIYAIWKAPTGGFPVVYLDSEGGSYALASDFDQFLQLIATNEWAGDDDDEANADFQAWVRAQGLEIPQTGDEITDAAKIAYADFTGWCDEAAEGTLSAETAAPAQSANSNVRPTDEVSPDADLWTLMVAAIGQRIDSPVVQALIERCGAKPLKPATPHNDTSVTTARSLGIEISASCNVIHRAFWPMRKEGRIWVTYVFQIALDPSFPDPLPLGLDWAMSREALDALGTRKVRGAMEIPYWALPSPRDDLDIAATTSESRAFAGLLLNLPEERAHITVSVDYEKEKPLVYVEDAFFTVWCALNGLLCADKFTPEVIEPLRNRRMTPLEFLHGPCGRLLWSGDIAPDGHGFVSAYFHGFSVPDAQRWVADVKKVFGPSNHFRNVGAPMTEDSWENFDRIAPFIRKRYEEWRRGPLKAKRD